MQTNYKNWVPKAIVDTMKIVTIVIGIMFVLILCSNIVSVNYKTIVLIILGIVFVVSLCFTLLYIHLYNAFSYTGEKRISARIINKIAEYVEIKDGGIGLDIGCGSGALTNAVAKRNPKAKMLGLDRWGKEYASFNQKLCEDNARAEAVIERVSFTQGDACKLDYPDETFDAITSNYCIHNIPGNSKKRQAILLEDLRVLKKGGVFVIHDIFTKNKYGDMQAFIQKLKDMGYEKVELIDTTNGLFLSKKETSSLLLNGSALLIGKK